jgi:hypothetical protein
MNNKDQLDNNDANFPRRRSDIPEKDARGAVVSSVTEIYLCRSLMAVTSEIGSLCMLHSLVSLL